MLIAEIEIWFGQTVGPRDIAVIGLLIVLEGVLSIDNALVLGLLARRLPKHQQGRALTYGLVGAFVFRLFAIATASWLLKWRWVKLVGGLYLVYVALKFFLVESRKKVHEKIATSPEGDPILLDEETGRPVAPEQSEELIEARVPLNIPGPQPPAQPSQHYAGFWSTVFVIEMTDIAFAVDSILAAIALVGSAPADHEGPHPKLWVVLAGGMLGVILMRFAAVIFIKMLEKFPRFETAAYLLVVIIGGKLVVDWGFNSEAHPHRVDFHNMQSPAFWTFWILMLLSFGIGFIPKRSKPEAVARTQA